MGVRYDGGDLLYVHDASAELPGNEILGQYQYYLANFDSLIENLPDIFLNIRILRFQTIIHWISLTISLGSFYLFTFLYNVVCFQCIDLPSNTWVLENTLFTFSYWFLILISTFFALLPRYVFPPAILWMKCTKRGLQNNVCFGRRFVFISLKNSVMPDDVTKAVIDNRRATRRKENFLVSWSRSTSASSIYR